MIYKLFIVKFSYKTVSFPLKAIHQLAHHFTLTKDIMFVILH